jgi:branched-chain amino acid transport system permease protein
METTTVIQYIVDAISFGLLAALISLSLSLLFGVMGLLNLAYGELIMIGGYTMYLTRDLPWPVLVAATIVAVSLASLAMDRLAFRPVRNADPLTMLVTSFVLSFALQHIARLSVGSVPKGVRPWEDLVEPWSLGGVLVTPLTVLTAVAVGVILFGLSVLLRRTRFGIELRASTEDFTMAALLGSRGDRVIAGAFLLTGVLAGVVSLLYVARTGAVTPVMGLDPLLIGIVGGIVGGLGSLVGATVGGFFLGAVSTALQALLPVSTASYTQALVFTAVIAVLVLRPEGIVPGRAVRSV